jgi:hypothetical protein
MQTTPKKKANDLHNVFAAFVALAAALFAPTTSAARATQQPAPAFTHILYEDFADGRRRELTRWQDTRLNIPEQEIDRLFARVKFEEFSRSCDRLWHESLSNAQPSKGRHLAIKKQRHLSIKVTGERSTKILESLADRVETRVENRVAGFRWCLIRGRILHDSHRWI